MVVGPPLESVLIANRGEIAVRVARTCKAMAIRSIAVYSDADAESLHVRSCDEAIPIGGVSARDSYLRADLIVAAAKRARAQAVHPGYGFLSENADFAQACTEAGLVFIGPAPSAMRAVGDKIAAKQTAAAAGVPVLAGYMGSDQSAATIEREARAVGLPLLIKAAAGGGGRGMRLVQDLDELGAALEGAQREAQAAFGDATVFLERFVAHPRHIEIQILGDAHGTCLALGERECSIQRRFQKIVEESPSPAVDAGLRAQLEEAAVKIARAVGYTNAGTVEFMLDKDRRFYFLEMNARLQVEHPVTEMVTGIDLVREQLLVAAGEKLRIERRAPDGHAIETRIYAEDPSRGFLPSSGRLTTFEPPQGPGIRNDVAVAAGDAVSAAYDPMLAKLIVHAPSREASVASMLSALEDYLVGGLATNLAFLHWLVAQPEFGAGETTTDFLERHFRPEALQEMAPGRATGALAVVAAAGALADLRPYEDGAPGVWQRLGAWRHSTIPRRVSFASPHEMVVEVERDFAAGAWRARLQDVEGGAAITAHGGGVFSAAAKGSNLRLAAWQSADGVGLSVQGAAQDFALVPPPGDGAAVAARRGGETVKGSVQAPMSGTIVKVAVRRGDTVASHQVLLVMEAMKMEHAIVAPYPGTVTAVSTTQGSTVAAGDTLIELEEA